MGSLGDQVVCKVRSARKAKGLSQSQLAERVGVKRQAIYDMEVGRYVPNTAIALRLARELGCKVEDLFVMDAPCTGQPVALAEEADNADPRVSLARVRERLVAYPLGGRWMINDGLQASDGLLALDGKSVRVLQPQERLEKKALLLGCDPAFALLGSHVSRIAGDVMVQCRFASSYKALEALSTGHAHIAGTHLHNSGPSEANLLLAQNTLAGSRVMVVAFSFFEEGLMVARGNPLEIRSVADLAKAGIRFVNREPGAALRILLDEHIDREGVPIEMVSGYHQLVSSHNQGAQMVAFKLADAALGLRAVAAAHGLDFVPMEAVRCDLVIPCDLLDHPAVKIILDALQTRALRDELASLPGYESSWTGSVIGRV